MGLKVTKEVIDGDDVTRYNGNNPSGGRERGREAVPKSGKSQTYKRHAWKGRKAAQTPYWKEVEQAWLDTCSGLTL